MKKTVILLVNYKNDQETIELTKNILCNFESLDIVIVNNDFGTKKLRIDSHPNLLIVNSEMNLGYFGGMQYGLEKYLLWREHYPEWIIISNTDIEIISKDLLVNIQKLDDENTGIIAPMIISGFSNNNQNPFMLKRPSKKYLQTRKIIFSNKYIYYFFIFLSKVKAKFRSEVIDTKNIEIYAPHGSFIIINKRYFERGGDLRFNSFLFGEEIFLGEITRNLNLKVKYNSTIKIKHNEHATTSLIKYNKKREYLYKSICSLLELLYKD